jgi:superfamily II DNA helicase RecQ
MSLALNHVSGNLELLALCSSIGTAATGAGKTMMFWLPCLFEEGITFIITPLKGLGDQIATMVGEGIIMEKGKYKLRMAQQHSPMRKYGLKKKLFCLFWRETNQIWRRYGRYFLMSFAYEMRISGRITLMGNHKSEIRSDQGGCRNLLERVRVMQICIQNQRGFATWKVCRL